MVSRRSSGARTTRSWVEGSSSTTPTSRSASLERCLAKRTVRRVSWKFARGRRNFEEMILGHGRTTRLAASCWASPSSGGKGLDSPARRLGSEHPVGKGMRPDNCDRPGAMDAGLQLPERDHRFGAEACQLELYSRRLRGASDGEVASRAGDLLDCRHRRVRAAARGPALEAAHIRPFKEEPQHYVQNGLRLRSDVHSLFDAGYVTVTPEYQFEVSDHNHTDFDDGEHYYELGGTELWVPRSSEHRPGREPPGVA